MRPAELHSAAAEFESGQNVRLGAQAAGLLFRAAAEKAFRKHESLRTNVLSPGSWPATGRLAACAPPESASASAFFRRKFFLRRPPRMLATNRPMLQKPARPKKKIPNRRRRSTRKYLEGLSLDAADAKHSEEKLASMYRGGRITGGVYIGKRPGSSPAVACGIFFTERRYLSRLSFVTRAGPVGLW